MFLEIRAQANACHGVYQVTEIDPLVGGDTGKIADGFAFGPLGEGFTAPLVGHLECVCHMLLQPLHQIPQKVRRFGFVGGLGVSGGGGCQIECRGVIAECGAELVIGVRQAQEDFVSLLLVFEVWRFKWLDEIDVEIPRRNGRGTFVGCAEEKIPQTGCLTFQPFQFVLPNFVAGSIGLIGTLHDPSQGFVVVAVELGCIETFSPLFDQSIEVIGLLEIEIVLPIIRVGGDELPADGLMDFPQNGLHLGEQVIGWIASQLLNAWLIKTERIPQFLWRGSECGIDVAGGEAMY